MTMGRRRLMLAIGAVLLVGGWGATRYAVEQQRMVQVGTMRMAYWDGTGMTRMQPSRNIFAGGVISMAIGAGLIGFAVLRPTNRNVG